MMRAALALVLILPTGSLAAQGDLDYYARLGVTFATRLVKDDIIQEIEVQQNLAPTLVLGASLPIAPQYRAGLEATLASSGYHSNEAATETDLGTLRTGSVLLALEGPVWHQVFWRAGMGLIRYWPADDSGIFLQGGSTSFMAGGGLDYRHQILSQWELMAAVRYDYHRFTTDELKARGFAGSQGVQRISASLGLARARR